MREGRYNDGRRATAHRVTVALGRDVIAIRDADELTIARWPLSEVRWLGKTRFARGDERLALADREVAKALRRSLPRPSRRGLWRGFAIAGSAVAAVVMFFWIGLPLIAGQVARAVPPAWEQQSGSWMEKQVVRFFGDDRVCAGTEGREALDTVVERLAAASPPRLPVTVTVVDSPVVNALALPGGRIVVFRGLIDEAEHPNEVAGVLAHEMAHADLRHPTEVAIERVGGALVVSLLVGDVFGGSGFGIAAQTLLSSAYSREAERAADARALATMQAADLDAAPFAAFFERLAKGEGAMPDLGQALAFADTHPPSRERAEAMRASSGTGEALDAAQWRMLKAVCGDKSPR